MQDSVEVLLHALGPLSGFRRPRLLGGRLELTSRSRTGIVPESRRCLRRCGFAGWPDVDSFHQQAPSDSGQSAPSQLAAVNRRPPGLGHLQHRPTQLTIKVSARMGARVIHNYNVTLISWPSNRS